MTLGQLIRHHRDKLGLTQAQLAERLGEGWTQSRVAEIEGDDANPRFDRLKHVANKLEVPLWKLLKPLE